MIAQSSDFRLTRISDGTTVSDTSQKLVVLEYGSWVGWVTYTGIARYGTHRTDDWLTTLLTHELGERAPREVVDLLRTEGDAWLQRVPRSMRHHTFTLALFAGDRPCGLRDLNVRARRRFTAGRSRWPIGRKPIQAASATPTSHRPQRPRDGGRKQRTDPRPRPKDRPRGLRYRLALANRAASRSSSGTVSEGCITAHLWPDGSGEAQVYGNTQVEFSPSLIMRGQNMANFVSKIRQTEDGIRSACRRHMDFRSQRHLDHAGAYRPLENQTGDGWPDDPEEVITQSQTP
jgi:hypothetical protein